MYPSVLRDYCINGNEIINFHNIDYELMKNNLGSQKKFGFLIEFNTTKANLDSDKPKNDDDKGKGFLPGFEAGIMLCAIALILLYIEKLEKSMRK
jgi:hypothetical protein